MFLVMALTVLSYSTTMAQGDLESTGTNSWIFHTPDDGRTTLYIAPKIDGSWQWGVNTQFLNNGNVIVSGGLGVGTGNLAGCMLAVNGIIRAKEVRVESGWADFVFAPGYRLRPLEEVEQHIKEHGHLPEVPSAEEVRINGVDLGKTDVLLLQKIEELTLYLLEQDKKLKEQEALLRKQQKQIDAFLQK